MRFRHGKTALGSKTVVTWGCVRAFQLVSSTPMNGLGDARRVAPWFPEHPGGAPLTTYQVGKLYACRANNFQRPSCFSQTCSTPTRAELALPSLSVSAEKMWRAMVLFRCFRR
jgi:hypothetical protein